MEQSITFEIVALLLSGGMHARAVAAKLGTNHMTINRRLRELVGNNVLDMRKEGRNSVYLVKKSAEAKSHVLMSEAYMLEKLLDSYPELRRIVDRIQKDREIGLALFFGSYAKGEAGKDSDIDVFIETASRRLKGEIEGLDTRLSVKIGGFDATSLLGREMQRGHVIIKGIEDYYEKTGFFR